jgi:hypothetical protein
MSEILNLTAKDAFGALIRSIGARSGVLALSLLFVACALMAGCEKPAEVTSPQTAAASATPSVQTPAEIMPAGVPIEIVFLGQPGIDVAGGPTNAPDGEPDFVIQVDIGPRLLKEVASWEIEAQDGRSHWTSKANPNGWWLIKVVDENVVPSANGDRSRVKLCFKGDPQISSFTLRGIDSAGIILVQQIVRK